MTTVFLSGSRKMARLNDAISERLNNMMSQRFHIIVGDANGADKAMQSYLANHAYDEVTVFCSGDRCRNNIGNWPIQAVEVDPKLKGRAFYTVKDKAMALIAEYGFILWDGESKGSLANAQTLLSSGKPVALYHRPSTRFFSLKRLSDLEELAPMEAHPSEMEQSTLPFDVAS